MHPDDTVPDMQLSMYDATRFIAGDGARSEAGHSNKMIMYGFDVVIDQQRQALRQTMIHLGQLIKQIEEFLVAGRAVGQRFPNGDHSLAMAAKRGQPVINVHDKAGDRLAQLVRGAGHLPGDV